MTASQVAADEFDAACGTLMQFFGKHGFAQVSGEALNAAGLGRFRSGWQRQLEFSSGQTYRLAVVAPEGFPYVPPRLAVLDGPPILAWPHLEEHGLLCVFPSGAAFDVADALGQVEGLLHEGIALIERILCGDAEDDFREEVVSYWVHSVADGTNRFISLLEPDGPHRKIAIWRGQDRYIVGEDAKQLERWLVRRHGAKKRDAPYKFGDALFLRAPHVPVPSEYPSNAADVRTLFAKDQQAQTLIMKQALGSTDREMVLGFDSPTGQALVAVSIDPAQQAKIPGRAEVNQMWKGFRPNRLPQSIALMRATTPRSRVTRHRLERADHRWVHGRDHDNRQKELRKSSVLIVGCGSLGSTVAELLAKAGVGNLKIVDPETLDWPNLSRHALGADDIARSKAEQVAAGLRKSFPHLGEIEGVAASLGPVNADLLQGHDVVVSTTGIWQVDRLISDRQVSGHVSLAVYGWLEPNAAAAHVVTIPKGGACLCCGMTGTGRPNLHLTDWLDDGLKPVPACGGSFNSYGATELTFAHGLVAEAVLKALLEDQTESVEQIWVGRKSHWAAQGGKVSPAWQATMGDPGDGGFIVERPWPRSASCGNCQKADKAA